jgi:hypothetical protein
MTAEPPLAKEMATFNRLFPHPGEQEGRFAVIQGDELLGTFSAYDDALAMGYRSYGLKPFLVKLITSAPEVANYTRRLAFT